MTCLGDLYSSQLYISRDSQLDSHYSSLFHQPQPPSSKTIDHYRIQWRHARPEPRTVELRWSFRRVEHERTKSPSSIVSALIGRVSLLFWPTNHDPRSSPSLEHSETADILLNQNENENQNGELFGSSFLSFLSALSPIYRPFNRQFSLIAHCMLIPGDHPSNLIPALRTKRCADRRATLPAEPADRLLLGRRRYRRIAQDW